MFWTWITKKRNSLPFGDRENSKDQTYSSTWGYSTCETVHVRLESLMLNSVFGSRRSYSSRLEHSLDLLNIGSPVVWGALSERVTRQYPRSLTLKQSLGIRLPSSPNPDFHRAHWASSICICTQTTSKKGLVSLPDPHRG